MRWTEKWAEAGDNLQRLQAVWALVPDWLKAHVAAAIVSAAVGLGAWLVAKMNPLTAAQAYVYGLAALGIAAIVCEFFIASWRDSSQSTPAPAATAGPPPEVSVTGSPKWLRVEVGMPALGPGALIPGTNRYEASLSMQVHVINRSVQSKVSLRFYLGDSESPKKLSAVVPFELLVRDFRPIPGFPDFAIPLAVGPQEDVTGHIWFFYREPVRTMPLEVVTIEETIRGESWSVAIPQKLAEVAREIEFYTVQPKKTDKT